jgi:WD40 repeat protein
MHEISADAGLLLTSSVVKGSIGHTITHRGRARLWDTKNLTLKQTFGDDRHQVTYATMTADGRFVAAAVEGRDVEVWNTATGKVEARLRGGRSPIQAIAISPDGKAVVTTHEDRAARLWDVEDRGALPTYPRPVDQFLNLDGGRRVAVMDWDAGEISVLDARSLRTLRRIPLGPQWVKQASYDSDRNHFAYDAQTNRFAVRSSESQVLVVDGAAGRLGNRIDRQFDTEGSRIDSLTFTAAGRRLLIRYQSGEMELVDPGTGTSVRRIKGTPGSEGWYRRTFAVSPDGGRFLINVESKTPPACEFHIHDAESGELVRKLEHKGAQGLLAVAFAPGGRLLATVIHQQVYGIPGQPSVHEGDVHLWDLGTGDRITVLRGGKGQDRMLTLGFDSNGTALASGDEKGMVRVWDVGTGKERVAFQAHKGPVRSACFVKDGSRLATAGAGGAALWDARTGDLVFDISATPQHSEGADAEFQRIDFVADGQFLVTTARLGLLQCWPTDPLAQVRARGTRALTPEERRQFAIEELR